MANKEQTYTIKIDAELSSLQDKVTRAKQLLDGFISSGKAPKGLVSSFEKLEGLLGRISDKSKQAPSKSLFSGVERDLSNAELLFGEIIRSLDSLKDASKDVKLELFPPESRAQIQAAINGLKEYQKILKELKEKESEVEGARKVAEKADKAATTAKQSKADIKRKKEKVETKRTSLQGQVTALETDPEKNAVKIAKLKGDIAELDLEIKNLTTDYNAATKTLTEANKAAAEAKTRYENLSAELDNLEIESLDALSTSAKKAGREIEEIDGEAPRRKMERLNSTMQTFVDESLAGLPENAQKAKTAMDNYSESVDGATDKTRQAKQAEEEYQQSLADKKALGDKIKSFLGIAGAAKTLSAALRNAFEATKELDKAMTEIAVVTDFEVGDMWDQLPEYTQRANELGISITSAYEASALFYQQGLTTNEMIELSNETLKMARIAGLDAAEATDRMTAALRGFNMELDQASAQKVADVYSELAAITASDVDEISKAMTKTASIASSAGMEFETTAAFLSQIIETTRESAETAGTAMKTVIARFQELKKDPSEIGEVEGEIVDANAIETALRSVGVSLRDASGQFRELDDVFLELSSKWNTLDKNTQRYIATIAAGSRQQSRFIAMMQDYERTQQLVTAANNSAGASQKQYEKTLDSLATKLAKLENAWTEFSTGLINSDLVKFAVDFLTSLLNALNKVTAGFDGFSSSLTKIGTLIAVFQLAKTLVTSFFDNLIGGIYNSSVKAGENIVQGTSDGMANKQGQSESLLGKIIGTTKMSAGKQKINEVKDLKAKKKVDDAGADAWGKKKAEAIEKHEAAMKNYNAQIKEAEKNEEDYTNIQNQRANAIEQHQKELDALEKERIYTTEEANNMSKEGFKMICDGAEQAAQALTAVGVGIGAIGQMFIDAGLEGVGEFFSGFGQVITVMGSALMGIIPIVQFLGTTFTIEGGKIAIAGTTAQFAWWWILVIVAAVAVLAISVAAISKAMKDASPEGKLEKAQEAADRAADAADNATESYENLKGALESLQEEYKALEDLTRGTKEWDGAVQDINKSVLDLIQKYPELAKLVDNKGGVLTLDMDDSGVQEILKKAEESSIVARNSATMTSLNVARKEDDLERSKLSQYAKIGNYVSYGTNDIRWVEDSTSTKALAKALASGAIINNGSGYEVKDAEAVAKLGINEKNLKSFYNQTGQNSESLREFGESLLETQAQEEAAFSAIATSAMSLADTLSMTEEQVAQASNIVDNSTAQAYYDEKMKELGATDFTSDGDSGAMNEKQKKMRDEAIRAQYGSSARIEGNKVTFRDAEGNQKTEELTSDEIKAIIANNYATNKTAEAVEVAPMVIDKVIAKLGYSEGSKEANAIEAVTQDQQGGNLTLDQVKTLTEMSTDSLKKVYATLSDEEKKIFGSEQDYLDKIQGAANIAKVSFDKATDSATNLGVTLSSFMTADMAKGFVDKLEDVANKAGGKGAAETIGINTQDLLSSQTSEDKKQEIQSRINMTDWTNQEALLALQIDLEQQYGYSHTKAKEYVDSLGQAAYATSNLTTTVKVFGDLWKATEKANQSLERLSALQWEYNRALEGKGGDIQQLVGGMIEEYKKQAGAYEDAYNASNDDLAKIYAQGGLNYGIDLREFVSLGNEGIEVDQTRLQDAIDSGKVSEEDATKWLESLSDQYKTSQEHLSNLRDTLDNLEELEEESRDAYFEVRDMVKNTLIEELQKQIDIEQQTLDATKDANSQIINKLQEQIDEQRQRRENEEAQQNIADMQSQAAYLGMDTSGANALEVLALNEQIAQAEQDYQDSLIDQAIEELSDANEKAYEQRERQIEIAQAQLDAYVNSEEFQRSVTDHLNTLLGSGEQWSETPIGKQLIDSNVRGMSQEEKDTWLNNLDSKITLSKVWGNTDWEAEKAVISGKIDEITTAISGLGDKITGDASNKKIASQATTLAAAGFDVESAGVQYNSDTDSYERKKGDEGKAAEGNLNRMTKLLEEDKDIESSENYKMFQSGGIYSGYQGLMSQQDYYRTHSQGIAEGTFTESYSDYLSKETKTAEERFVNALKQQPYGGVSIAGTKKVGDFGDWDNTKEDHRRTSDVTINGQSYSGVQFSANYAKGDLAQILGAIDAEGTGSGIVYLTGDGKNVYGSEADSLGIASSELWVHHGDKWRLAKVDSGTAVRKDLRDSAIAWFRNNNAMKYETGGLADFTGPAWLDGTPSKPEYILNAKQTERFFSLVDVLEGYDTKASNTNNKNEISVDVDINVENISSDYDVEQMANKIRSMLYDDAMYRNVNNINLTR